MRLFSNNTIVYVKIFLDLSDFGSHFSSQETETL